MFDRNKIKLKPLSERKHDLDISSIRPLDAIANVDERWRTIARKIIQAKKNGASVILMAGGHVFRSGIQNFIIDMMENGYISCLATNGAGMIHDYELALIGATTESVAKYIREGQFGLWSETGRLNDIINKAYGGGKAQAQAQVGMGEAVGKEINTGKYPYKNISIFAAASRLNIPVTVHIGIGYDIIFEHPNLDGAAMGALSYNDFLKYAAIIQKLENGVVMNFGSAVMAPEIFLKALSMARNVAHQENKEIKHFTSVVCDLYDLPEEHAYYFRPWKTMLVRTTADGGESHYIKGRHAETIPSLWTAINNEPK